MDGLNAKQQKALDALLRGCTQEAAAREAGVSRRTWGGGRRVSYRLYYC